MVYAVDTWNIKGAGIAHFAVAGGVIVPVYVVLVRSMAGVSFRKLAGAVAPPIVGSAIAAGAAAMTVHALHDPALQLLGGLGVGSVVYFVVLGPWLFRVLRRARALWGNVDAHTEEAT